MPAPDDLDSDEDEIYQMFAVYRQEAPPPGEELLAQFWDLLAARREEGERTQLPDPLALLTRLAEQMLDLLDALIGGADDDER